MRCTDCNKTVKPVVAVDIDGTLAQYHVPVTLFSCKYFDRTAPTFAYDGNGPFRDYLELTQTEHRAMKLAYRQGGNKRWARPYQAAPMFTHFLRELGCEVWVATTRPWQRLDNIDPDTQEWLRRNQIGIDGLLYGDDKYHQLADTVGAERVIAVIEDLPAQYDEAMALGLSPIQIRRDHNAHESAERELRLGFGQMVELITNRYNDWKGHHHDY